MRAGAQARTIFAGLGVSGCLLAAIGAAFALTGGVLAFQGWPELRGSSGDAVLSVAPSAAAVRAATAVRVVRLPAAALAGTRPSTPSGSSTPSLRRATRLHDVTTLPAGSAAAPAPVVAGVIQTSPPVPQSTAADAVEGVTSATARTVRSIGAVTPAAAPATELVGGTVDSAGRTLAGIVRQLTGG